VIDPVPGPGDNKHFVGLAVASYSSQTLERVARAVNPVITIAVVRFAEIMLMYKLICYERKYCSFTEKVLL